MRRERGKCENCNCDVPDNRWVCDDCFPYFDGEKFLNPEDYEIVYLEKLPEMDVTP